MLPKGFHGQNMKICSQCQSRYDDRVDFCFRDGTPLSPLEDGVVPPATAAPESADPDAAEVPSATTALPPPPSIDAIEPPEPFSGSADLDAPEPRFGLGSEPDSSSEKPAPLRRDRPGSRPGFGAPLTDAPATPMLFTPQAPAAFDLPEPGGLDAADAPTPSVAPLAEPAAPTAAPDLPVDAPGEPASLVPETAVPREVEAPVAAPLSESDTIIPDTSAAAASAAEIESPEFEAPEIEAPEIEAPEIEAPEIKAPEIGKSGLEEPETAETVPAQADPAPPVEHPDAVEPAHHGQPAADPLPDDPPIAADPVQEDQSAPSLDDQGIAGQGLEDEYDDLADDSAWMDDAEDFDEDSDSGALPPPPPGAHPSSNRNIFIGLGLCAFVILALLIWVFIMTRGPSDLASSGPEEGTPATEPQVQQPPVERPSPPPVAQAPPEPSPDELIEGEGEPTEGEPIEGEPAELGALEPGEEGPDPGAAVAPAPEEATTAATEPRTAPPAEPAPVTPAPSPQARAPVAEAPEEASPPAAEKGTLWGAMEEPATQPVAEAEPSAQGAGETIWGSTEAASTSGTLTIRSNPVGAIVKLGDQLIGRTPLNNKEVPLGRHVVRLELDGYDSVSKVATIDAGSDEDLGTVNLKSNKPVSGLVALYNDAYKGAKLFIDNQFVGVLPVKVELTEGNHRFTVRPANEEHFTLDRHVHFEVQGSGITMKLER